MFKAIILAAGEGTRMKSKKSKVLHEIAGRPLIYHILNSVKKAGFDEIITVLGRNYNDAKEIVEYFGSKVIKQPYEPGSPYGTGYAAKICMDEISEEDDLLIMYGDTPLIDDKTIENYFNYHKNCANDITVLSAILDDPKDYGRIVREDGEFKEIVEKKNMDPNLFYSNEINSGIYLFKGKAFLDTIVEINDDNPKKEYMLTDTIAIGRGLSYKVDAYISDNHDVVLGVNDREDLYLCECALIARENKKRMISGVMIHNPESTYIDPDAIIEEDVELSGFVKIIGKSIIRSGSMIENSTICNMTIGENCHIINSTCEDSVVEDGVKFGPYSRIRPGSHIASGAKIGNFVEIKNSNFGEGSKAGHLAYIGDADVGRDVNIGCGVVFVNYDGKKKHRTTVGDHAFVGSNVNLVAPVVIEDNAFLAAGSTITKDVSKDALSIERGEQKNIDGWVIRRGLHKEL
ncbi:MAG: bifunctional UDP-N-acetylglucosamine diphosphorylase/glucosamine-1-phosphate N-acetyltransferase GlmU [Ezakiella sp.]|nr:bifunctional UDP-N-acetylglucosamine diphosphorylase/glucosamine-1-phosphate N-acetyltransferase GlmU [Ezakiella sp.]